MLIKDIMAARLNAGLTKKDLAEKADCHPEAVTRMETGQRISVRSAKRIADVLGVAVTDLPQFEAELEEVK